VTGLVVHGTAFTAMRLSISTEVLDKADGITNGMILYTHAIDYETKIPLT
jgi:hypothetical protein